MAVDLWFDKMSGTCCSLAVKSVGDRLTWFPDTLRRRQSVTEDPLVPQTSEAVDDVSALVQNRPLDLVLVGV